MPNWTTNILNVYGDDKDLKEFDEKFHGFRPVYAPLPGFPEEPSPEQVEKDYTFSAFVPVPEEVLAKPYSPIYDKGGTPTAQQVCGYNWQIYNWGVKWDVRMDDVIKEDECYMYYFDTPWDWPEQWLISTSKKFPHLLFEITSEEESGAFCFRLTMKDGEVKDYRDLEPEDF